MSDSDIKIRGAWHPLTIMIIGILFSFLPGGILFALNETRLGRPQRRKPYIVLTVILFVAVIIISYLFSDHKVIKLPLILVSLMYPLTLYRDQIDAYKKHIANGGGKCSFLSALPVVLVSLTAISGLIFSLYLVDNRYTSYLFDKSISLLKNSRFDEAESYALKLMDKYPEKSFPYMILISVYENTDRINKAVEIANEMRNRFPNDPEVKSYIEEFDKDYSVGDK